MSKPLRWSSHPLLVFVLISGSWTPAFASAGGTGANVLNTGIGARAVASANAAVMESEEGEEEEERTSRDGEGGGTAIDFPSLVLLEPAIVIAGRGKVRVVLIGE